jgi:hypothetical protein
VALELALTVLGRLLVALVATVVLVGMVVQQAAGVKMVRMEGEGAVGLEQMAKV